MARPRKLDAIQTTIQNLGAQIGQALAAALTESFAHAVEPARFATPGVATKGRRGRPPATGAAASCKVPGCGRKSVAKGMCQNHYAKARRLNMKIDALGAPQLKELAQDGRALRFKK